jgi:hypothetical protein
MKEKEACSVDGGAFKPCKDPIRGWGRSLVVSMSKVLASIPTN